MVASDGSVEDKGKRLVRVYDKFSVLTAKSNGDFERRRDEQVCGVGDPVPTTLVVLLFQFSSPYCFSLVLSFSVYGGFILFPGSLVATTTRMG